MTTETPQDREGELFVMEPLDELQAPDIDAGTDRKPLGIGAWVCIGWLAIIVFSAVFADLLPLSDPASEVTIPRLGPFQSGDAILGADANGRDMLARVIYGARTSLIIASASVAIGFFVGGILGLLAGYFRNWAGNALVSLFDILLAIPQLVLALSLVSVLKGDPTQDGGFKLPIVLTIVVALGIVSIPLLARITRASTLAWSKREFVTAARAQGATHGRILFREVLPNVLPAMVSIALLGMAIAIVAEGGLAILGASVEAPTSTWGTMISQGKSDLQDAPFIVWIPIFAVFMTAAALNYLGDVIRDRFDVRESAL
ncbi:MAG: ABC transporter permease [Acidimicrobiales bacterium]|nr:ABC transporter permease [Acidimicrobiales bacterium]